MNIITLFEIVIFCPKIQLWFPEKIIDFFLAGWKTRENVVVLGVLDFLNSCWQLWIHEKNCGDDPHFLQVHISYNILASEVHIFHRGISLT